MVSSEAMAGSRRSWPWWRWVLTGLSTLALALSGYLGWHYLAGGTVIGCGGGSPCDQVLNSRWSAIGGVVPVSGLAAGVYLAVLVASVFIGRATESPVRRLAWRAILLLLGAAAGSAVWFIVVQKWFIGAFCPYCMTAHITGLLLAALVIWRAPLEVDADSTAGARTNPAPNAGAISPIAAPVPNISPAASGRVISRLSAIGVASCGVALAGIMAVCQFAFTPAAVFRGGESLNDNVAALDPRAVPLVGSPDARYVVNVLFDYQCRHCQQLHVMLDEAVRRYGGKLAFVLCPAPLNTQCNPYISGDAEAFKDSCELAKIALTVWVAEREAFPVFDSWMFSPETGHLWHPRTLDAARARAVELVGQTKFATAQRDPWIDRYLQTTVRIYGENGANAVPKLVFGPRWVTPQPNDADDLILILQRSLTVPKP